MSYQASMSIWNGETSMDVWYHQSLTSKQELKKIPSRMLYASEAAFNRDSSVLPSASFYDDNFADSNMTAKQSFATRNKLGLRVDTDKPLPSPPKDPYFEYMFADADFVHQNDEETEVASPKRGQSFLDLLGAPKGKTDLVYDYASPPESQPTTPTNVVCDSAFYGFEGTVVKQESPNTPCFDAQYIIDNAGSTPTSYLPVNPTANTINDPSTFAIHPALESEDFEIADATAGFYGGYAVEESPSPYHAPNLDDDAGFGDIRDGCEHFPQQWTHDETQDEVVTPYKVTGSLVAEDFEPVAIKPVKPVLKPRSQIAKAARTCDMGFAKGTIHRASYTPRLTARSGFSFQVLERINGTKRMARDSVVTSDSYSGLDYGSSEEDEEPHSAKKARLSSKITMDADANYARMPSTSSLFELKHKKSSTSITNSTFHDIGDMAATVDGYPGQFRALLPPTKIFHPKFLSGGRPDEVTFGNPIHPNGLFHHTRFQGGGNTQYSEYSLDFSKGAVPSIRGAVGKALEVADKKLVIAGNTDRTIEQENLRRETHFECTMAHLESVSVGEYRYYQGHSSIEEYNQGGMCICWKECFCTNMCSRYGDMLCPCKKHIQFEEQ